jgi:hypothetical protein
MSARVAEFRSRLVGAWKLISYRTHPVNNTNNTTYPMGENASGIIMYTPDGYMAAQLMTPGGPFFQDGDVLGGSKDELATAMKHYFAYSGAFTVNENDHGEIFLTHQMFLCSFPNWVGNVQRRDAKIDGDILTLSADAPALIQV